MQPGVGDRILDRFRIDAVHGGGLGVLWPVTDVHTGRRYAVKSVKREYRSDERVVQRFLEEAHTWIALGRHEQLVQAFWLVEEGPWLFLEYVDGEDLGRALRRGPLPVPRAVDLAMQVAAAMAYAHTKRIDGGVGVVHRDLKPSNLLVEPGDRLKVTDFGLARVLRPAAGAESRDEPRGGTPAYMAPEQLRGARAADGRADVYSFGLILHEMIAGTNPLAAETFAEQARRTLEVEPPPLVDVPDGIRALVARCVAKAPEERPRDFQEVLARLAEVARGLDHAWHVDPRGVAPPAGPAALVVEGPVLRPRRPRAGEPFAAEIEVRGDVGAGPVELVWQLARAPGLTVLDPEGEVRLRVEAGGGVRLSLRANLLAAAEGRHEVPRSALLVAGPGNATFHPVKGFEAAVAFAFVLPLAGRDRERAAIEELVERGSGAVLLFGGPGSGKSRLLREGARLAAQAGLRPVVSRAQATGLRPMGVLNDMARGLLGESASLRGAVQSLLGGTPATARYFADLLEDGAVLDQDAPPAHHWIELLRAAARRSPLAVFLDDLQHADDAAVRIVLEIVARARGGSLPVVVVGGVGTGGREATAGPRIELLRTAPLLELLPLAPEDVARLLDAAFPGHGFREEAPWLVPAVVSATAGNPFHVTEVLRALRGKAERRDGEWRLPASVSAETVADLVPQALEEGVRERVHGLSPAARAVLELAALLGEEFDARFLREAAGRDRADAALEEMESLGVLRPAEGGDVDRYRFWSPYAASVVQRMLHEDSPARAHEAHAAVAGALEKHGDQRTALAVAQHLRAAGEAARSLPWTLTGCQRLLSMQLNERARRLLGNAKHLAHAAGTSAETRARFDYLYGVACESTGEYEEGFRALTAFVESGLAVPDDRRAVPRAYVRLGRIHEARGEYDGAQVCYALGRQILEDMGDLRTAAFVVGSLAALALQRGLIAEAEKHLGEAARLSRETGNEAAAIQAAILQGGLSLALGRLGEAARAFEDARGRAEFLGDRRRQAAALDGLGKVALERGYLDEARRGLERAMELRAWMGDRAGVARGLLRLGDVERASGRAERALHGYARALRVCDEIGLREVAAEARLQAGALLRAWGRTTSAVRHLAAAEEGYRALGLPERFDALRELAEALADAGSERAARLALARAGRGARGRRGRIQARLVRARLALLAGNPERARRLAARAARQAARTTGHRARIAAGLALAEAALGCGDLAAAARDAEVALAFAREEGDVLAAAGAERILLEVDARAGRADEARARAHRAARAYTGRADVGDGPARLLLALGRSLAEPRGSRYREAARRCWARLEAQGFRAPPIP